MSINVPQRLSGSCNVENCSCGGFVYTNTKLTIPIWDHVCDFGDCKHKLGSHNNSPGNNTVSKKNIDNNANTKITENTKINEKNMEWSSLSFNQLRLLLQNFSTQRDWHKYHIPRNLLLALVGEVGELCEIFQWKGDSDNNNYEENITHIGEELADILNYLVMLSDKLNVDLPQAVIDKIKKNEKKYPVSLVKGCSKKYTEY